MDRDQVKGKVEQGAGKVKEGLGKVTGDTRTEADGQNDQLKGKVKEGVGNVRNQMGPGNPVENTVDRLGHAKDRAGEALNEDTRL